MSSVPAEIEQIVRAAAAAPSGDNSQPWRFVFKHPNLLEFHAMPEKDNPLLNVDNGGTLIAMGAAVENAILEAKALGFEPLLISYADKEGSLTATLELTSGGSLTSDEKFLRAQIFNRHTNRKAYKQERLSDETRAALLTEVNFVDNLSLELVEDREKMDVFARNLTVMEEVALANKTLHRIFFADIFWSNARHLRGEPGLHGKTLELPPPAQLLFRALRHWPVAKAFTRIGFPQFVAETNAKQNASAAAFGAITSARLDADTYFRTGRLLERLWLQATAKGLSFQIVTGILFLNRSIETGKVEGIFSKAEQEIAKAADASIHHLLNIGSMHPVLIFRIGYSEPATTHSSRMKPAIEAVH